MVAISLFSESLAILSCIFHVSRFTFHVARFTLHVGAPCDRGALAWHRGADRSPGWRHCRLLRVTFHVSRCTCVPLASVVLWPGTVAQIDRRARGTAVFYV